MRRFLYILLSICLLSMPLSAQTKRSTTKKSNTTATTTKKRTSTSSSKKKTTSRTTKKSSNSIEGLKNERAQIQKNIRRQEQALKENKSSVQKRLRDLMILNTQIKDRKKAIEAIEEEISHLDNNIRLLHSQLETLQRQLEERKQKYVKSMRYFTRHHSMEDKLMFIFSARDFGQMYRRMRFVKEYASFQRAQGEILKVKQKQIEEKKSQLQTTKSQKNNLLDKGIAERTALENQHTEQQKMVSSLQRQQKTIQKVIGDQKKKDAALNAKIDKLIAEEIARQREAARKKAEAEALAKKRAEELARKKAAAEAAARENQRRIEAARAEEKRRKEEAAKASADNRARAEQLAREAEAARIAIERKAEADIERNKREVARANDDKSLAMYNSVDRQLSSNFESNKGRLPIPITGQYRIVSHFGQYNVEGLKNVKLDNKGINILGTPGCQARSIFNGEVSAVANIGGTWLVLVRHGRYISVYCNLRSVRVSKGQRVAAREALGSVGSDNILQFQLRRETAKLNPESWLGR
jgi:septal ring factor EnvC (AmiA/AmiB activator)